VPAGNMQDKNSEEYLQSVEESFEKIITLMKKKMQS
jgi:hypothetical protein